MPAGRPKGTRYVIEDRFDIMPLSEIAQRLMKYKGTKGKTGSLGWVTIARRVGIRRNTPREIVNGTYEERSKLNPKTRMGDKQQRMLSRTLYQLETGELTYEGRKWYQHEATQPLPKISRLVLAGGVVSIQPSESRPSGDMPSFRSLFGSKPRPELPKHLIGGK